MYPRPRPDVMLSISECHGGQSDGLRRRPILGSSRGDPGVRCKLVAGAHNHLCRTLRCGSGSDDYHDCHLLGQSVTIGSRQFPTLQFVTGGLAVEIWARVPPPYDVAANRSAAENPLPSPRGFPGRRDCLTERLSNPTDAIQVSMSGATVRDVTSLNGSGGGRLVERVLDVEQGPGTEAAACGAMAARAASGGGVGTTGACGESPSQLGPASSQGLRAGYRRVAATSAAPPLVAPRAVEAALRLRWPNSSPPGRSF